MDVYAFVYGRLDNRTHNGQQPIAGDHRRMSVENAFKDSRDGFVLIFPVFSD